MYCIIFAVSMWTQSLTPLQTQQDLIAEEYTVKYMTDKMQELDEEYCELEEKYKDAQSMVEEFLEGHKYIPKTKGQKFTNDIRTPYYRLLVEQIPPRKIEKSIKIVLETMMWQSRIEIEYYSVAYFERITEFDAL